MDQLTAHLKIHRKDYASTRGLMKVLSRRKSLMEYLKAHNRSALNLRYGLASCRRSGCEQSCLLTQIVELIILLAASHNVVCVCRPKYEEVVATLRIRGLKEVIA